MQTKQLRIHKYTTTQTHLLLTITNYEKKQRPTNRKVC